MRVDPRSELLPQPDVFSDSRGQALPSEVPDHHPEFQRAEATTQLDSIIHEVAHRRLVALRRAQVFWDQAKRAAQHLRTSAIEGAAVDGRKEPLVWVDHHRVRLLEAFQ